MAGSSGAMVAFLENPSVEESGVVMSTGVTCLLETSVRNGSALGDRAIAGALFIVDEHRT